MKNISFVLLVSLIAKASVAQYSLTFCESVNNDGKPQKASNSFMVDKEGSALKLLLKTDEKLAADQMDFRIFYINESGKEEQLSKLPQKVEPGWDYVWKEIVFFDPGNYRVKVYNSKGLYLTSANLKVNQE